MIYFDSCALLKFIKKEAETEALRAWRAALPDDAEFATSALAHLEVTRTLLRAKADHQKVPFYANEALKGCVLLDLSPFVLERARSYRTARLGTLDSIHLATADPFRSELSAFVTYDKELEDAAASLGFPVLAPGRVAQDD